MLLFTTPRLRVRRLGPADADGMAAIYGDLEAMRWVGDGEQLTRERCAEWIEVTLDNYARRGYGMCGVTLHDADDLIGCCGLVHPGGQAQAEIKYALRRDQWRRGYAGELVPALLAYGFDTLRLPVIIATAHPDNAVSMRVLLRSGMALRRTDDASSDTVLFELTRAAAAQLRPGPSAAR